ncbi:MAG: hypothetical protein QNJ44_16305 [Rhodobacter sp.]|nr:hypothetical protein [Rhodobacter sp.]
MIALRIALILPALADFILAGLTLVRMAGVEDGSIVPRLQFAGVAFAWGVMLLFALARPVERAWALLPTVLAVACVSGAIVVGYFVGAASAGSALIAVVTALACFVFGYVGLRFAYGEASQPNPGA